MKNNIVINRLDDNGSIFKIVPLKVKRSWMSNSSDSFAYKCLPLNIANQYGWAVLSPTDFTITWWGGTKSEDVDIVINDPKLDHTILSYFGESVFTLHLDFIVQTPENYSLYVRGIPNEARPGFRPLDAIVETDWLPFTFTYNFMLIEPGIYEFKKGDPLFSFFPIERNSVENFEMIERSINEDESLRKEFDSFVEYANERVFEPNGKYQRHYFKGTSPTKKYNIKNHITRLLFGGKSDTIDK